MRLLATSHKNISQQAQWSSQTHDVQYTIRHPRERFIGVNPGSRTLPWMHGIPLKREEAFGGKDADLFFKSRNQISTSLASFVDETRHAFMSGNRELHRNLAQTYREIGRRLKAVIERPKETEDEQETKSLSVRTEGAHTTAHPFPNIGDTKANDTEAFDVFLDCVSRFTSSDSPTSIDKVRASFYGSPEYQFESKSSFFPEQYTTQGIFEERIFVNAIMQLEQDVQTYRYFLTYAQTSRRWQRILLSITIEDDDAL